VVNVLYLNPLFTATKFFGAVVVLYNQTLTQDMTSVASTNTGFNSILSLQPLIVVLKRMMAEGKPGAKKLYQHILQEIDAVPELLQEVRDTAVLKQHAELVEALLACIF